jgi:prophage antirepressor-like protein
MQFSLQVFETENHSPFRSYQIDGEPWFALSDVCDAIGLPPHARSYAEHASRLDAEDRRRVSPDFAKGVLGSDPSNYPGYGGVILINEPGLYTLILRSEKPAAARFKRWIAREVLPAIRRSGTFGRNSTPAFIMRFNANWDRVQSGHFSVLSETATRVFGRFEMAGHQIADRGPDGKTENRLDISVGRTFSAWLKANHSEVADNFSYYVHVTPEWEGEVRQYPNSMLPLFIDFVENVWIPQHSEKYLSPRDPAALPYLQKIIPSLANQRAGSKLLPSMRRPNASQRPR